MKVGSPQRWKPTEQELDNKLREVRALLRDGKWRPGDVAGLECDFEELEQTFGLELDTFQERTRVLLIAAEEVTREDYAGQRPPEKSYKDEIKNQPLFPFCWKSMHFGAQMYFKFTVKGADNDRRAYPVSIHVARH